MTPLALQIPAWVIALAWLTKVIAAARGLPRIPNILLPEYDQTPTGTPSLTVIVPARNEAPHIAACLDSLLQQDYPNLHIIAIDDRSTDTTGQIIANLAARHPTRLTALPVANLPAGWLGKTHAMALAARQSPTDYLLFTDADVLFRPDALRRSLAHAVATRADHLVTVPTLIVRRWDEAALLGFFQIFGLWAARPWRVEQPKAMRDAVGIGAFNLLRRDAYLHIGGFEAQRMDILEDLTLARRIKQSGLRQRIAFGRGLVNVHWATGAFGLVRVMTKNIFSAFRYHASLLLGACLWLSLFCLAPTLAIFLPTLRLPAALTLAAVAFAYHLYGRHSGISAWSFVAFPFATLLFIYTLLRSMATTLVDGGVTWRGTFYPLSELRKHASPLR